MRAPVSIGVVGLGDRGRSIARILAELPSVRLAWVCDRDLDALATGRRLHPDANAAASPDALLEDDDLDAVVVATPLASHAELAREALQADKHVFVEQPLAMSGIEADQLSAEALRRGRCLVVGHTRLHHPAVRTLKALLEANQLGDVYYLAATRRGRGNVRRDENALWSLGAHDVPVLLHLLDDQPIEVSARGDCYVQEGVLDVVFCHLRFATGVSAHLHLSSLDSHDRRTLTVVGSKQTVELDDLAIERKLTVYTDAPTGGDIVSPRLAEVDPLRRACEHFADALRSQSPPSGSSREGSAVVHVLEALQESLRRDGEPVAVGSQFGDPAQTPLRLVENI